MAIPIPLLLIAGALGVKALAGRGAAPAPSAHATCSPEGLFGKTRIPIVEGGYPAAAAAYVEDWLESAKSGGTSVFYVNAANKFDDVRAKHEEAQANWKHASSTDSGDIPAILDHLWATEKEFGAAKQSAVAASWSIADQILKSIGCPAVSSSSEGLRQILVNEESWVRWLLAIGAYVNLSYAYVGEPDDWPIPMEIVGKAYEFIDGHFRKGLSMDIGKGQIEAVQYTSALRPLLKPLPGAVSTLRVRLEQMEQGNPGSWGPWLFGPLSLQHEPWTGLEKQMQDLSRILALFLSGNRNDLFLEEWMFTDEALGAWLAIELTGKKPTTDAGYAIMSVLTSQIIGSGSPLAYPDWEYLSAQEALGEGGGLPFSSVRGFPGESFWEWHDAYIREALSQDVGAEDIAVKLLGTQAAGANELERIFPSYTGFFEQNPGIDYWEYVAAVDAFKAEYPIVAVAISNLHTLIIERYNLDTGGDWGF